MTRVVQQRIGNVGFAQLLVSVCVVVDRYLTAALIRGVKRDAACNVKKISGKTIYNMINLAKVDQLSVGEAKWLTALKHRNNERRVVCVKVNKRAVNKRL